MIDRAAVEQEAKRRWPEDLHLGRWDGLTIDAERALLIQRQAFVMGAQWQEGQHE